MTLLQHLKIGFIGTGNMTNIITTRLFQEGVAKPENTWVSNRTPGKILKMTERWPTLNVASTNEEVVDRCQVIFLAIKPQDFVAAIEPLGSLFNKDQIVISLLAGIPLENLEKALPNARLARVMPNTPAAFGRGVIGYCVNSKEDEGMTTILEELLSPLGLVMALDEGEAFDALMVSASSGTGFILELMSYWQDWIEERGIASEEARKMTVETFLGAALLAQQEPNVPFEDIQARVVSKKGVTAAGLDSMRELELERVLRISFEKACMRNQELSKSTK